MPRPSLLACVLALSACSLELNPSRPPPDRDVLAPGGVWVAYNLGCEEGCDQVKRGDRILAVDDRPVSSGSELDAIGLARGAPLKLRVAPYGSTETREVTIVAAPNERRPPIAALPPFMTVGTAALDKAPEWARNPLFGHTIPALRFYRADEPRGFITGRELYGRAAVILLWSTSSMTREERAAASADLQLVYAQLQRDSDALQAAAIDVYFVSLGGANLPFRQHTRDKADPGQSGFIPIFELESNPNNGNTVGIMGSAADIRETLRYGPAVLVLDRRGIIRFHARPTSAGLKDSLAVAVDFAHHALPDVPTAPQLASR